MLQNRERLEDLKIAVRLCKDLKAFQNFNSFLRRFFALASHKLVQLDQPLPRKLTLRAQVRWLQRRYKERLPDLILEYPENYEKD